MNREKKSVSVLTDESDRLLNKSLDCNLPAAKIELTGWKECVANPEFFQRRPSVSRRTNQKVTLKCRSHTKDFTRTPSPYSYQKSRKHAKLETGAIKGRNFRINRPEILRGKERLNEKIQRIFDSSGIRVANEKSEEMAPHRKYNVLMEQRDRII